MAESKFKETNKNSSKLISDTKSLQALTGFTASKCVGFLEQTGWTVDESSKNIKKLISSSAAASEKKVIAETLRKIHIYDVNTRGRFFLSWVKSIGMII